MKSLGGNDDGGVVLIERRAAGSGTYVNGQIPEHDFSTAGSVSEKIIFS